MANLRRLLNLLEFYIKYWKKQSELFQVGGLIILSIVAYIYTLNIYLILIILIPIPFQIYNLYNSDKGLKKNYFYKVMNISAIDTIHVKSLLIYTIAILSISILFVTIKLITKQTNINFEKLYCYVSFLLIIFINIHKIKSKIFKYILFVLSLIAISIFIISFNFITNALIITILVLITININKNEYLNKF